MSSSSAREIGKVVGRLGRRLRIQSGVRRAAVAGVLAAGGLVVGVALHETWLIPTHIWLFFALGCASLVVAGALAGLLRRLDQVVLAERIDDTNDLKDRLGTALSILRRPAESHTEVEQAQIRDAAAHAPGADHRKAAPWRFPWEATWAAALLAAAWGLATLNLAPPEEQRHALRPVFFAEDPLPLPPRLAGPPMSELEPEEVEEVKDTARETIEETRELAPLAKNDADATDFVDKLNETLQALVDGKLTDKEGAKSAADMDEALDKMAGTPEEQEQHEQFAEALADLGKELEKEAERTVKDEEVKQNLSDLAKALEERKYEEAAKQLEKLLDLFDKLPKKDQQRLAKMFESLAKKFQSQLSKDLEKIMKERDRLNKKQDEKGGLSNRDKDRLNKLNKQMDRLKRKYDEQSPDSKKQLDRLSRELRDLANRMDREKPQQGQKGQKDQQNPGEDRRSRLDKQEMQRLKEMMQRMAKQQQRQRLQRMGKMRLADLRELMKQRQGMGEAQKKLERLARGQKGSGKQEAGGLEKGGEKGHRRRQGVEWWARSDQPRDTDTHRGSARDGEGTGHGRDRMLAGPETDLAGAKTKDDFVAGERGEGPSSKAILYGAATEGTRVKGYGQVHIDYSMRAARQMAKEEVPPGYREYVEEYFRLIRKR